ncbi:tyrosine-protein phosphatase [Robertmurraya korlensis]|uniref:tyrosine-protein phosphatase n=1 Tax=Robertmurraya korlensis TaxID=519977 RepID=UPI000824F496|nr:CpsB/CapC family capsule biosynthesis tyrosine phosphatase [Robertmurraya korlensis]
MIDIHCHILPSLDDGAKDISESVAMAREAVKEGIDTIIATPHHKNGQYENKKLTILEEVKLLNKRLQEEKIPLNILPGQETRIFGEFLEEEELVHILPLNQTQYVFVELPSGHVPRYTERLLFDVQLKGFIPIIVHPERNTEIITNPDIMYNLVKKGALTQVTASSVAGYFGKKIQKFSAQLIEANLTHFLASDAHNVNNRTFKMMDALDMVEAKFGVDMVYFYTENAELLIEGKNVMKEIPERVKAKKFLGIF